MGILELFGFGKKTDTPASATGPATAPSCRVEPVPAAVQDSCCGSCGGQGHDRQEGARK